MQYGYNPRAYVPGGSTRRVAQAIQTRGWKRPVVARPTVARVPTPVRPGVRPVAPVAKPGDPVLGRASSIAEQLYAPLLARLGAAKAAAEASARSGYSAHASALERALTASAAPIGAAYDQGIASTAAVNEAVANRLKNTGATEADSLKAKLAQINANPSTATDLANYYTGASNAGFARDSADLTHLIGQKSEAMAYQGKLPQIARLTANQDLQSALAQMNADYSGQERELNNAAVQAAGQFYGDFRAENFERQQAKQQQIQDRLEMAAQERASLRALAAAATTTAEKQRYASMEKAADRQLRWDIAEMNAQVRRDTDNPPAAPKPPAVTGPPNQKFISVNGKRVKNPNYVPPEKGGSGNTNDTWETPGSAKRNRVEQRAWSAVVSPEGGWNADVLRKLRKFPNSSDAIINTAINQAMRSAGVKDPNHPAAKEIRKNIRIRLSGRTWQVKGYEDPFEFRAG